ARDLRVTERVLLDVDARHGAGLRDRPVNDDLTAEVRVAPQRALVAALDGAQPALHLFGDHVRIQLAVYRGGLGLERCLDRLLGRARAGATTGDRAATAETTD